MKQNQMCLGSPEPWPIVKAKMAVAVADLEAKKAIEALEERKRELAKLVDPFYGMKAGEFRVKDGKLFFIHRGTGRHVVSSYKEAK